MTTALAVANGQAPTITADQMALITKTVAKDATPDELKLYLYDCARQGVHPLDKLVHFTKRGGKYTPVTSIDFMRIQAAATGEYAGSDVPLFAGEDGVWSSLPAKGVPIAAMVTVWRLVQGQRCKFEAVARWDEYKPDGQAFMWSKMPHTMLGKCAEALALRKGFPKQLAGLYAREEMDQAGPEPVSITPLKPVPADVVESTGEVVPTVDLPPGALVISSCEPLDGKYKKAGNVTFSDGVKATVWQSDGSLFDLAVECCQKGTPVIPTLQAGKGSYGPTLKGLKRAVSEHDQRVPDPPHQIDGKDLPF